MSLTIGSVEFGELFINALRNKAVQHTPVGGTVHGSFIAEFNLGDHDGLCRIGVKNTRTDDDAQQYSFIIDQCPDSFGRDSDGHTFTFQEGDTVFADDDEEHEWAFRIMKYIMRWMY